MTLISVYFHKNNLDVLIKVIKISILVYVGFSLFASAIPFYLGYDDITYGLVTINLSKGIFEITNDLFEETGHKQFIPSSYISTVSNTAIPKSSVGIYAIGAIVYLIGGFYGLLYFGPIVTILLYIIFERIVTKFFGNLAGLLALLLLVSDWQIFFVGLRYLTDVIFTLFFIIGIFILFKFFNTRNDRYLLIISSFFVISTLIRINGVVFFPGEVVAIAGFYVTKNLKIIREINRNNLGIILKQNIFSSNNIRKFVKTSLFITIPWILFVIFWAGYNDYYFGDLTTNYREQVRSEITQADEEGPVTPQPPPQSEEDSIFGNTGKRGKLIQYFSVPLMPDPLYFFLVITSDTDLEVWRSDIWISYVTFLSLAISAIISIYYKIKRKEIFTILLFIGSLVFFYSSPLIFQDPDASHLSEHANNRYMIPASILSFILIAFIIEKSWNKVFNNDHFPYQKFLRYSKFFFLILIAIFFLSLIITMPSIQDSYQTGFHFNNPFDAANSFENLEKLPEKSIIVGNHNSRETLLHTDTHFYPYNFKFINTGDTNEIPKFKTETLKRILSDGYTAYAYKINMFTNDAKYFKFLETDHGIILKDYSETFCKLELISENQSGTENLNSDSICYNDVKDKVKKIWNVTLKWPN